MKFFVPSRYYDEVFPPLVRDAKESSITDGKPAMSPGSGSQPSASTPTHIMVAHRLSNGPPPLVYGDEFIPVRGRFQRRNYNPTPAPVARRIGAPNPNPNGVSVFNRYGPLSDDLNSNTTHSALRADAPAFYPKGHHMHADSWSNKATGYTKVNPTATIVDHGPKRAPNQAGTASVDFGAQPTFQGKAPDLARVVYDGIRDSVARNEQWNRPSASKFTKHAFNYGKRQKISNDQSWYRPRHYDPPPSRRLSELEAARKDKLLRLYRQRFNSTEFRYHRTSHGCGPFDDVENELLDMIIKAPNHRDRSSYHRTLQVLAWRYAASVERLHRKYNRVAKHQQEPVYRAYCYSAGLQNSFTRVSRIAARLPSPIQPLVSALATRRLV
jgi:hypothetical protein